jgi:hypothetical protein
LTFRGVVGKVDFDEIRRDLAEDDF